MTALLLLALAGTPAEASSEILFRTTRPVTILVDGQQAPITGDLRMRASDLEPGPHDVEVRGVFGRTLYVGQIEIEDQTLSHAEWVGGELAVYRTEPLKGRRNQARRTPWAEEEPEPDEAVVAVEEPPEDLLAVQVEPEPLPSAPPAEPAAEPLAIAEPDQPVPPAVVAAPPAAAPAMIEAAPPVVDAAPVVVAPAQAVAAQAMPVNSVPGAVRIQAQEGMRLELVGVDQTLEITVLDGAFVVIFPRD